MTEITRDRLTTALETMRRSASAEHPLDVEPPDFIQAMSDGEICEWDVTLYELALEGLAAREHALAEGIAGDALADSIEGKTRLAAMERGGRSWASMSQADRDAWMTLGLDEARAERDVAVKRIVELERAIIEITSIACPELGEAYDSDPEPKRAARAVMRLAHRLAEARADRAVACSEYFVVAQELGCVHHHPHGAPDSPGTCHELLAAIRALRSDGPATRPMRPVGVVTSTGVLTDAVDLPAFPDEDGEAWLRRHVEAAVTPTEPPVVLGGVYRVEVGGATYWMKLDEPTHDHVMAALATVDDDSSPLDIGDIVALGDAELDRRHTDEDEEPYTLREIASMRPAPCVLGCSEWS